MMLDWTKLAWTILDWTEPASTRLGWSGLDCLFMWISLLSHCHVYQWIAVSPSSSRVFPLRSLSDHSFRGCSDAVVGSWKPTNTSFFSFILVNVGVCLCCRCFLAETACQDCFVSDSHQSQGWKLSACEIWLRITSCTTNEITTFFS